jgi:hypothetical protein
MVNKYNRQKNKNWVRKKKKKIRRKKIKIKKINNHNNILSLASNKYLCNNS